MESSPSSRGHQFPGADTDSRSINTRAAQEEPATSTIRSSVNPEQVDAPFRRSHHMNQIHSLNNDSSAQALLTLSGRPPPTANERLLASGSPAVVAPRHPTAALLYEPLLFSGAVAPPFVSGYPVQEQLPYNMLYGRHQPPHLVQQRQVVFGGASAPGPKSVSSQSPSTTNLPEPTSFSNPSSMMQQEASTRMAQQQQQLLLWSHHQQQQQQQQQHIANLQQSLTVGGGIAAAAARPHDLSTRLGLFGSAAAFHPTSMPTSTADTPNPAASLSRGTVFRQHQNNKQPLHAKIPFTKPSISTTNNKTTMTTSTKEAEHHDRAPVVLYVDRDGMELSPYQCLVRQQIEVFQQPSPESKFQNKEITTQGRNRPIVPGQVGLRCRHCCGRGVESSSSSPSLRRPRGKYAMLFPSTLLGAYQSAQNMANTHLLKTCTMIPDLTRKELVRKRTRDTGQKTCKSAYGGGRNYWADGLRELGVVDSEDRRLRFSS